MHNDPHRVLWPALLLAITTATAQDAPKNLQTRVDDYFEPLVAMQIFSGTVLVARGGEVLVDKAYGFADLERQIKNTPDTRFKLMSVTKSFTAVAVMRLMQNGKLALEDPVAKHLPDWPDVWRQVRIHDLLDHSSGFPELEPAWTRVVMQNNKRGLDAWQHWTSQLDAPALVAPPGTQHRYSNVNYELLGVLLEVVTGSTYRTCLKANVLEPAGLTRTGSDDGSRFPDLAIGYFRSGGVPDPSTQDMSGIQAAGGVFSTTRDLYRLDRALRGDTLLSAETKAVMHTPRTGSYACGFVTEPRHGRPCLEHSGGANGYVAEFLRFPEDDACVVALSNFAFAPIGRIGIDLGAMLFDQPYRVPHEISAAALQSHAGVYRHEASANTLVLRPSGSVLLAFDLWPQGGKRCAGHLLIPLSESEFAMPFGDGVLRVEAGRALRPLGDHTTELERVTDPALDWQSAVGEYEATPQLGERVRIKKSDQRLLLQIDSDRPAEFELVPVSAQTAMALYADDGGTLLVRKDDQLEWLHANGTEYRLRRR